MSVRIALGGPAREAAERVVARLVEERIASRITAQDPTFWGDPANGDLNWLVWTESVANSANVADQVEALRRHLPRDPLVIVPRTNSSAIAASMMAHLTGGSVTTDMSEPADMQRAVFVESPLIDPRLGLSPFRVAATDLLRFQGIDPLTRIVLVLSGPADGLGDEHTVQAGPTGFGDTWSSLTAAALVPAGLAGADIGQILDEAGAEAADLAVDAPVNNGLLLGAALSLAHGGIRVVADGTHIFGMPAWSTRLLAETPALDPAQPRVEDRGRVATSGAGRATVTVRLVEDAHAAEPDTDQVLLSGALGELMLVWQYAAAVTSVLASTSAAS